MELISQFKIYLQSQKNQVSSNTLKNYLADIRQFAAWVEKTQGSFTASSFTSEAIEAYLISRKVQSSSTPEISERSIKRHTSSLRKFTSFLLATNQIKSDPFEGKSNGKSSIVKDPWRLQDFRNYLYVFNASPLTIKNYIIDIKQFLEWIAKNEPTEGRESLFTHKGAIFSLLSDEVAQDYKSHLLTSNEFTNLSINRKLSSLRKFFGWARQEGLIKSEVELHNVSKFVKTPVTPLSLPEAEVAEESVEAVQDEAVTQALEEMPVTSKPIRQKAYSSFPPLRMLQKLQKAAVVGLDATVIAGIGNVLDHLHYLAWIASGKQIFSSSAKSLTAQFGDLIPTSQIRKVLQILTDTAPHSLSSHNPQVVPVLHPQSPLHIKLAHHARHTRPNWYRRYHQLPVAHYIHIGIFILFVTALGFGVYRGLFEDASNNKTLAAPPTAPPRVMSFQGRLTDNNSNPITSAKDLRFAIYNDQSASGAALLWQETQQITPDTDGIFSTLLGSSVSIPSSVFTDNSTLYLGITVQSDAELAPRQQIATVAFAANAETLQGLFPITAVGAGQSNVVLALDSSGDLTIGGSASPTFAATGGEFTISGNVLSLTTTSGSNANINLNPNGLGKIDAQKPIINTTLNNNIQSAAGAVEVDDLFAILASSSGQSALTINQTSTGPLISASSSGVARFTVSNNGDITAAGDIAVNGGDITSTGDITFNPAGGQLFLADTDTLAIGGHAGAAYNAISNAGGTPTNPNVTADNDLYVQGDLDIGGTIYVNGSQLTPGALVNYWQRNSGAVSPANITDDLLLGATATSSAIIKLPGLTNQNAFFNLGTGNLGVGTTSPVGKLNINGATTGKALVILNETGGQNIFTASASGTTRFVIENNGNVGINDSSADQALSVGGSGQFRTTADVGSSARGILVQPGVFNADQYIRAYNNSGFGLQIETSNTGGTSGGNAAIKLGAGGTSSIITFLTSANSAAIERMRLDTSGNLGIGTTSPIGLLNVSGAATGKALAILNETGGQNIFTASASGTTRFVIQNDGNVGIGSTTPAYKLDISGGTGIVGQFSGRVIGGNAVNSNEFVTLSQLTGGTGQFWQRASGTLSPTNITDDVLIGGTANATASALIRLAGTANQNSFFNTGGNVGIGSTAPTTARLEVGGNAYVSGNIGIATTTLTSRINLPAGTTAAEGIAFGTDVSLYRGAADRLDVATGDSLNLVSGNLQVGGTTVVTSGRIVQAANGTAGAPAFTFSSDNTNGMFLATTDTLGFSTAGSERMRIASNGNVGIGTTTTTNARLDVVSTGTTTHGLNVTANSLTSGFAANLSSTSTGLTTGGLLNLDWSPGSATTGTGDLFSLNIGANGSLANLFNIKDNGSSIFSVSETQLTTSLPVNFTSPGDVSIAYDLMFTNPTSSYIKSSAPLYIQAGETYNSSDLVLGTYNTGNVIVDSQAFVTNQAATISGQLVVGTNTAPANISNFYLTNSSTFGKALAILNQTESADVFTASTSGTTRFVINANGNVGIGQASPIAPLDVTGDIYLTSGLSTYRTAVSDGTVEATKFCTGDGETNCVTDFSAISGGASIWTDAGTYAYLTNGEVIGNSASAGSNKVAGLYLADSAPAVFGTDNDITFSFSGTTLAVTQGNNDINFDSNTLVIDGSADSVGVGTTAPAEQLSIRSSSFGTNLRLNSYSNIGEQSSSGSLFIGNNAKASTDSHSQAKVVSAAISGYAGMEQSALGSYIRFFTFDGTVAAGDVVSNERLRIDGSGNVGVGTSSPLGLLNVSGAATGKALAIFNETGGQNIFAASASGTTRFVIQNDGNVGIGTATPSQALFVNGNIGITGGATNNFIGVSTFNGYNPNDNGGRAGITAAGNFYINLDSNNDGTTSLFQIAKDSANLSGGTQLFTVNENGNIGIGTTTNDGFVQINGGTQGGNAALVLNQTGANTNDIFAASASGTTRFVINNAGNVGIGSTSPSQKLDVAGGILTNNTGLLIGSSGVQLSRSSNDLVVNTVNAGSSIRLYTGNAEKVTIDGNGNVGIGSTSPLGKLNINGAATGKALAIFNETGGQNIFAASASGTTRFVIQNNGNVGIGTSAPGYLFDVQGGSGIVGNFSGRVRGANAVNSDEFATLAQLTGGTGQYWQRAAGSLSPTNITDDVLIGGTANATASALIRLPGQTNQDAFFNLGTGNLGVGTTSPGARIDIESSSTDLLHLNGTGSNNALFRLQDDGTETAAIYSLNGETNLRLRGVGDVYIDGGGVSNGDLTISSSGNVGVGTTSPAALFQVRGTSPSIVINNTTTNTANSGTIDFLEDDNAFGSAAGYGFRLSYDGSGNYFNINSGNATTNTNRFTIQRDTGNIGIGSATPAQKLDVAGNIISTGNIGIATTSVSSRINLPAGTTANEGITFGGDTTLFRGAADRLDLNSGDSFNLVSGALQVAGTTVVTSGRIIQAANGTAGAPAFTFSSDATNGMFLQTTDTLGFSTAGSQRVTINANGNVGIGSTTPLALFNVNNSTALTGASQYGSYFNQVYTGTATANKSTFGLTNALTINGNDGFFSNTAYGNYNTTTLGSGYTIDAIYGMFSQVVSNSNEIGSTGVTATTSAAIRGYIYNNSTSGIIGTQYGVFSDSFNNNTGTITTNYGGQFNATNNAAGTISNNYGVYGSTTNLSTGTITNSHGGYFRTYNNNATGTIGTGYGVRSSVFANVDGAVVTNAYGIYSDVTETASQTSGGITTGYAGYFQGTDATTTYGIYAAGLQNNSTVETFSNLYGVFADCQTNNANVTVTNCYAQRGRILESAGTITNGFAGYFETSAALGTAYGVYSNITGASTTNYGGYINTTGATNNYGLRITGTPASSTNYGLYVDAAAQNYFAGNVGIGSTTPAYKLDVSGGTGIVGQFSGRVIGGSAVNSNEFVTLSQLTGGTGQYWQRAAGTLSPTNITDDVLIGGTANATSSALIRLPGQTNQDAFFNLGTGNVAVGTTTPLTKLDVRGSAMFGGFGTATAPLNTSTNASSVEVNIASNSLITLGDQGTGVADPAITLYRTSAGLRTGTAARLVLDSSNFDFRIQQGTNATAYGSETYTDRLTINSSGNIGITGNLDVISAGAMNIGTATQTALTLGRSGASTTINGSALTVGPTAWTATPTISGLITATSGLTANGALTANNTFTLGDNGDTGSVNTSDWDISTTGALTGISGITTDGGYTQSGVSANTFTGTTTFSGAIDSNGDLSVADTNIAFDGASTTFTTTGAFTLTPGGAVLLGDGGDTMQINSSDWDISTTGALTGISGITTDGAYTQSGTGINYFSGNVGVGSTAPQDKVQIDGTLFLSPDFHDGTYGKALKIGWEGDADVHHSIQSTISQGAATANGLRFYTHGGGSADNQVLTLVLAGTGNVGINTTSPVGKFNVDGAATGKALAILNETGGQNIFAASASGTTRFVIQNDGNVGIGTSAPGYLFDVQGGTGIVGNFSGRVRGANAVNSDEFATLGQIAGGAGQYWQRAAGTLSPTNITDDVLIGGTANATASALIRFAGTADRDSFINTGGNVGIGTSTTDAVLHVKGRALTNIFKLTNSANNTAFQIDNSTLNAQFFNGDATNPGISSIADTDTGFFWEGGNGRLAITMNATERFSFSAGGNLGIGESSPGSRLAVSGGATIGSSYDTTAAPTNGLLVEGNVGIGTSSPVGLLNVNGAITGKALATFNETGNQDIFTASASGTTRFVISNSGNVGIGTTTPRGTLDLTSTATGSNPSVILGGNAAGDTDFWIARVNDGGNDDDDTLQIGDGVTPGTNPFITLATNGNVGIGTTTTSTGKFSVVGGDVSLGTGVQIDFADATEDKIYLWGTSYGLGVSSGEANWWSGGTFSFRTSSRTGTEIANLSAVGNLQIDGDLTISGGNVTSATTFDSTLTSTGALTANGALNANGTFTLGDNGDTGSVNTSDWDISTTGALTGISGITTDGGYTQSGATANTFTGATTFSGAIDSNGDLSVADTDIAFDGASTTFTITGDLTLNPGGGQVFLADTDTLAIGGHAGAAYNAFSNAGGAPTNPNVTADNDLYVQGDLDIGGTLYVGGSEIANYWSRITGVLSPSGLNDVIAATTSATTGLTITQTGAFDVARFEDQASDTTPIIINSNGNLGIGTTTAGQELDVNGDILVGANSIIDTRAAGTLTIGGTTATTLTLGRSGQTTVFGSTAWTATPTISGLITANAGLTSNTGALTSNGSFVANGTFTLGDNGDTGSVNTSDWDISTTGALTGISGITTDGGYTQSGSSVNNFTGNVAIGTTAAPNALLQVRQSGGGAPSLSANTNNVFTISTSVTPELVFGGYSASPYAMWMQVKRTSSDGTSWPLAIQPLGGNVGIGTENPGQELDVNGDILVGANSIIDTRASGTLTIGGTTATTLTLGRSGQTTVFGSTAWTATPTISGLITATSGLTADGALTANNTFTLGDNGDTGSVNTSDWDISTTGVLSGVSGITTDGGYTQSGSTQNTFSGNIDATSGIDITGANLTVGGANFTVAAANGNITSAGDLAVNGGDITSTGDITLNPAGGDVYLADTDTLIIGGHAGAVAYSAISNAGGSPSNPNVTADNDLYVQGDLDIGGTLYVNGSQINPGSLVNYWQQNSGSLAPATATDKVVLGGNTTTNHQFEVNGKITGKALISLTETGDQNILVASSSATSTVFTLSRTGSIQLAGGQSIDSVTSPVGTAGTLGIGTTNQTALTLGRTGAATTVNGSATSAIDFGNFDVATSGNITVAAGQGIDANAAGILAVGNVTATTINMGSTNLARAINIGTGTAIDTINIGTGGTGVDVIRIGASVADLALTDANWSITTAGLITTADDIAVNGGDITSTAGTFNFLDNTTTKTIDIGGVTSSATDTINIATNATANDTIAIGNSHVSTLLTLTGGDDWSISNTGIFTLSASAAQTTGIVITDTDYTNALSVGDNNIIGTTANIDLTNFDVVGSTGNITTAGDLAVNGDDITSDGTLTIDAVTDIQLDAAGSDIILRENGVTFLTITDNTTDAIIAPAGGDLALTGNLDISGTLTAGTTDAFVVAANGSITTAGDLALNGNDLTSTGDIVVNPAGGQLFLADTDTIAIGGHAGAAYNALSNAGGTPTNPNVTADNDLYVQGDLDIGGTLYVGGNLVTNYWTKNFGVVSPATENDVIAATSAATTVFTATQTGAFHVALFEDQAADTSPFVIDTNGNVGIGTTTTSAAKVTVSGSIHANSFFDLDSTTYFLDPAATGQSLVTAGNIGIGTTANVSRATIDGAVTAGDLTLGYNDASATISTVDTDEALTIDPNGTGAINFHSTASNIDANGLLTLASDLRLNGNDILDSAGTTRVSLGATTTLTNTTTTLSGTTTLTASSLNSFTTAASLAMNSTTTLTLGDNATINGSDTANGNLTLQGTSNATRTTSYLLLQPNGGNVGIGTTAPTKLFHLYGDNTSMIARLQSTGAGLTALTQGAPGLELLANGMNTTSMYTPGIKFGSTDPEFTTTNPKFLAGIFGRATESYTADTLGGMAIDFFTFANGAGASAVPTHAMTIDHDGQVGIGTTSPDSALHVVGGGHFTTGTTFDSDLVFTDSGATTVQQRNGGSWRINVDPSTGSGTQAFRVWPDGIVQVGSDSTDYASNIDSGDFYVSDGIVCVDNGGDNCDDAARNDGTVYSISAAVTGIDLAEEYPSKDSSMEAGDIVIIDSDNTEYVKKSNGQYQNSLIGVISSAPGIVLGGFGDEARFGNDKKYPIALAGRIPTKVSTINGPIKRGDYLTSSPIPGVAMKATRAGQIVAKAVEDYSNPDPNAVGKVIALVNVTYSDPEIQLAQSGNLNITGDTSDFKAWVNGMEVKGKAAYMDATIANLQAGLISVRKIVVTGPAEFLGGIQTTIINAGSVSVNTLTIAGQSLQDYILSVVENAGLTNGTTSPVANTTTDIISPLSGTDVEIKGDLKISKTASTSGDLSVDGNATIAGTLRAQKIVADEIEGLEARIASIAAEKLTASQAAITNITNITNVYNSSSSATATQSAQASGSATLSDIVPSLTSDAIETNYLDAASLSAGLAFIPNLNSDFATFNQGLMAFGPSSLNDVSVAGQLAVNGSMILAENSINVLGADLEIQPLRQGNIAFMGGLISIDTEGNFSVGGNATFAKNVTVNGKLTAKIISPVPAEDLVIELPGYDDQSTLAVDRPGIVVKNASGSGVLKITDLGDVIASGAGKFGQLASDSLKIVRGAQADTSLTETIASSSAGTATIKAGQLERTIYSKFVTADSLIYITATSDTTGATPFVARQTAEDAELGTDGSFTIRIPSIKTTDVKVNWWIIN